MRSTCSHTVFVVDNHVYSSPNSNTIPRIPRQTDSSIDIHLRDTMTVRWADNRYPGFPFIPTAPRFNSEPFRCLKPPRDVFPIEGSGTSWRLSPATVNSLSALENDLHLIERTLRAAPLAKVKLPSHWGMFRTPRDYGYRKIHETRELAQASALKSRDAFLPLIGWCSFLMSHFHQPVPRSGLDIQRWEPLLQKAKFSLDYIQIIKTSELVDFSPTYRRTGVFIEHSEKDFGDYIDLIYRKSNVPCWIHWGDVRLGAPKHDGVLAMYLPSDAEVIAAKMDSRAVPGVAVAKTATTRSLVDVPAVEGDNQKDPVDKFPEPEKRSGQKRGESWQDFFARMDKRRTEGIAGEGTKAREARLAREKAQQNHPRPGISSRAPSVYLWEEDIETGFLLRKAISRNHVQDIWYNYLNRQRRYDSITNQWDICEALAPEPRNVMDFSGGDPYEDMESDDDYGDYGQFHRPLITPTTRALQAIRNSSGNSHVSSVTTSTSQPLPPTSATPPAVAAKDDVSMSSIPSRPPSPIVSTVDDGLKILPISQATCESSDFDNTLLAITSTSQPLSHAPSASAASEANDDVAMFSITSRPSSPTAPVIDGGSRAPSTPPCVSQTTCKLPGIERIPLATTSASQHLPPVASTLSALTANDDIAMSSIQSRPSSPIAPVIGGGLKTPSTSPPVSQAWLTTPSASSTSTPPEGEFIPSSTQKADEIDDTMLARMPVASTHSGEPGRYELIYGGPSAPLTSLSFEHVLLDDIYTRYGFIGSNSGVSYEPMLTWEMVEKIFGHIQSGVDKNLRGSLSSFLELLLQPEADPVSLQSLWDLAVDSTSPLADNVNTRFRLAVRSSDSGVIYHIEAKCPTNDGVSWQLVLRDAATVLECFRLEQCMSIRDLTLFLFAHGRPFSTCIPRSQILARSPRPSPPLLVLGWRPENHRPALNEYNFYEYCRRTFFDQHPHSRAAHTEGGIIWRLALEAAQNLAEDSVLDGPSEDVLTHGACIGSSDSEPLWDNCLSEAEKDLICGVYRYATGMLLLEFMTSHMLKFHRSG